MHISERRKPRHRAGCAATRGGAGIPSGPRPHSLLLLFLRHLGKGKDKTSHKELTLNGANVTVRHHVTCFEASRNMLLDILCRFALAKSLDIGGRIHQGIPGETEAGCDARESGSG